MSSVDATLSARLHGSWHDRSLDYDAAVQLTGRTLRIAYDDATRMVLEIAVDDLQGAESEHGELRLFRHDGKVVTLSGSPHFDGLRNRLEAAVCVFPAQTLSLRGFGSERSAPGSDHDRWFEALLTARRVAEESRTVETQRRAFDAERMIRHAQATREAWASDRFERAPDRRALVAELEELGVGYDAALRRMDEAASQLRHAPNATQFAHWREWTGRVGRAFRAADDAWTAMVPVLADSRGAQGSMWRKLIRGERRSSP
ncbi:MAG: hypothetical protein V4813_10865 [Gemmatimonadota bacterium]